MGGHLHSSSEVHPRSWVSRGSPMYNFLFRCCKEYISGSFWIEVLPVRLRLLSFRRTVFNLRSNLFYDDFTWSWCRLNLDRQRYFWTSTYLKNFSNFKLELQWMCHWIRIVSQLTFKCCYFDFVYCDFDVDNLVFEIQISFYCHLFLSANVRHKGPAMLECFIV